LRRLRERLFAPQQQRTDAVVACRVGGLMVDDVCCLRPRGHGESTGFAITLLLNVGTAIWFFISLRITMENLPAMPVRPIEVMLAKVVPYIVIGYI
jgi:hypothetical protein